SCAKSRPHPARNEAGRLRRASRHAMTARKLETHPIHLGRGGTAVPQSEFPRDERAMQWYEDYGARHDDDGEDGRLISCFRFTEDWAGWEMHPAGAEV